MLACLCHTYVTTTQRACVWKCRVRVRHYHRGCRRCRKWLLQEINDIMPDDDGFVARSFISTFMQRSIYSLQLSLHTIVNEMAPPTYYKLTPYTHTHTQCALTLSSMSYIFNEIQGKEIVASKAAQFHAMSGSHTAHTYSHRGALACSRVWQSISCNLANEQEKYSQKLLPSPALRS